MADPLKQFQITPLIPLEVAGLDLSFTNSSLWMMITFAVSVIFFTIATRRMELVPTRLQAFAETLYEFIANMVRENIGTKGFEYFPLVFTVFMTVFLGNALGLVPFSFTFTAQLAVNFAMATFVMLCVLTFGFMKHGTHFFSLFFPPGTPLFLAPIILPLEIVSFFVRPVTLAVRLFGNMLAGHILLKVIAGFCLTFASMGTIGVAFGILPTLFNVLLIAFEFLIAYLQAYVFAILTCIYLKDTVELAH